jgi:hypothetical protein
MKSITVLLEELYAGHERLSRDEIHRHAVASDLPAEAVTALDTLPEGEYAQDELLAIIPQWTNVPLAPAEPLGVAPEELSEADLFRELAQLYETRLDTLRHGSSQAVEHHSQRMSALELEYLRRYPDREVDENRLRPQP